MRKGLTIVEVLVVAAIQAAKRAALIREGKLPAATQGVQTFVAEVIKSKNMPVVNLADLT